MPIKFRCQHCRQFLGISRAKAGEVFDCPTCGRTIRVPDLDGKVKPLPKPGLNLEDSRLASALNELASIDRPDAASERAQSGDGPRVREAGDERVKGNRDFAEEIRAAAGLATSPEAVELPPLPPPEPIEVEVGPPPRTTDDSDNSSADRGWNSTAAPNNSWRRLIAAAEFGLGEGDSTDEPVREDEPAAESADAEKSSVAAATALTGSVSEHPAKGAAGRSASTWFALTGAGAVLFAAGFWAGRITTIQSSPATPNVDTAASNGEGEEVPGAASNETVEIRYEAFRGRITYRTDSGERRPDRGARVIVLPASREGAGRLSATGLREGDAAEDRRLAESGIRAIGGDVTTTDEGGNFEIRLPQSGQYILLALSNSLSRDEGTSAEAAEQVLAEYFDRPSRLLGRLMFQLEEVRYSGDGATPWDYSFNKP